MLFFISNISSDFSAQFVPRLCAQMWIFSLCFVWHGEKILPKQDICIGKEELILCINSFFFVIFFCFPIDLMSERRTQPIAELMRDKTLPNRSKTELNEKKPQRKHQKILNYVNMLIFIFDCEFLFVIVHFCECKMSLKSFFFPFS